MGGKALQTVDEIFEWAFSLSRKKMHWISFRKLLAAALDCGPCADLEGDPLLPHGLLEENIDRLGGAYAELREEFRRVVPRLLFHAYGDVDRLHRGLLALRARHAAIVRAEGEVS